MSHFSVIVATKEYPTDETLRRELQPFHEYECTGVDDEFVVDVDKTGEIRAEFEKSTASRLRDAGGQYHCPYDDRFYREPTAGELVDIGTLAGTGSNGEMSWTSRDWGDGRGYRTKIQFVPDGMVEVEVQRKQFQSLAEYVEGYYGIRPVPHGETPDTSDRDRHKYGYCMLDEAGVVVKVVDRTNPNSKWDYWRVGGRYCRKFVPKTMAAGRVEPLSWEWEYDERDHGIRPPDGVDSIRKGDMDVAAMKEMRVNDRLDYVKKALSQCGLADDQADAAFAQKRDSHTRWKELPEPRPRGAEYGRWLDDNGYDLAAVINRKCWDSPDIPDGMTVDGWVNDAPYLTGFAFLRERQWAERGEMGWWGAVHDENGDWDETLLKLVGDVPDDWYLTVVDCHI